MAQGEQTQETKVSLEKTLLKAKILEKAHKVRDRFRNFPSQIVENTLSVIELAGESKRQLGEVAYPLEDLLRRSHDIIRERWRVKAIQHGSVTSLSFSPTGEVIASGHRDGSILLWDLRGNLIGEPFVGHSNLVKSSVISIDFNQQGTLLVSSSEGGTVKLWDLFGNLIKEDNGHHSVRSVSFNSSQDVIAFGLYDGSVRFWQISEKKRAEPIEGSRLCGSPVVFSPRGDLIACSWQKAVNVFTLSGKFLFSLKGHTSGITSIAFSPNGDLIATGSSDRTIRVWNLLGESVSRPFLGHTSSVCAVAFGPDGSYIVSGGDKTIRLWNLIGLPIGVPLVSHSGYIKSVAVHPEKNCLVSTSKDETIRLWDLSTSLVSRRIDGYSGGAVTVTDSSDGYYIAASKEGNSLGLLNLSGNAVGASFGEYPTQVSAINFSAVRNQIVSGDQNGVIRIWNMAGEPIGKPLTEHSDSITSVAFSLKGDNILSASRDGTIRLWDLSEDSPNLDPKIAKRRLMGALSSVVTQYNGRKVSSVAFHPEFSSIAIDNLDGTFQLYDLTGDHLGKPLSGHAAPVSSIAFSLQGDYIASGSKDGSIRLWTATGETIGEPFLGHSGPINSLAFSPEGQHVISGGSDNTIRLWDLSGNSVGEPLRGHVWSVESVVFSPDGEWAVSVGGRDGSLRIWKIGNWKVWLRHCCDMLIQHSQLTLPQSETAHRACDVCKEMWTQQQSADFAVLQSLAMAHQRKSDAAMARFKH